MLVPELPARTADFSVCTAHFLCHGKYDGEYLPSFLLR